MNRLLKNRNFVGLILPLLSILAFIFVLKPHLSTSFPYTHDGENHLARFANYKIAVREGQVPPRFAPNLNAKYGYPVFNYNYPLANILSLPASVLGFSYELTFKLMVILAVFASGVGAFFVIRKLNNNNRSQKSAWLAAILYMTAPYLVSLLFFRGNIGEIAVYALLPWMFLLLLKTTSKISASYLFISGIAWAVLLLSHTISSLASIPFLIFIWIIHEKNWLSKIHTVLFGLLFGVLLTVWYWIPALSELSAVVTKTSGNNTDILNHLQNFMQFFIQPIRFGFSYPGPIDTIGVPLGLPSILLLITSVLLTIKLLLQKSFGIFSLITVFTMLLLFLQTNLSSFIWSNASALSFIQFPWRISLFIPLLLVLLLPYLFSYLKRPLLYLFFVFLIFHIFILTRLKPANTFSHPNVYYDIFGQTTSSENENMPPTYIYVPDQEWQPTAEIIEGDGSVSVNNWNGSKREYEVTANTMVIVVEPTVYFLGWETLANNIRVPQIFTDSTQGRIAYQLDPGTYKIKSMFTQNTPARKIGNTVSLLSLFVLAILAVLSFKDMKKKI